jgi:hypothetical protein
VVLSITIRRMFRFKEPTHAAQVTHEELPAEFGRSGSELVSERMAEMRMTGEAKVQRKHSEIRFAIREVFQRVT